MIRYDGYYILPAKPYEDGVAHNQVKGFAHLGYQFLGNGTYSSAFKRSKSVEFLFERQDFNPDFPNKYLVSGNSLTMYFHTNEEWEFTETLEILNAHEIKWGEKILQFKSWPD